MVVMFVVPVTVKKLPSVGAMVAADAMAPPLRERHPILLFANAKPGEDRTQDLFRIDPAGQARELGRGGAGRRMTGSGRTDFHDEANPAFLCPSV